MTDTWAIKDLEYWDAKIQDKVQEFNLSCFSQEFEVCDHNQMLGAIAYSGMPAHYPHWSYGKSYEKQKTMYDYGVSGLPYEMVINSNPSLAYLMRGNSLCLQVLTIAHVYGHNDFFRNNFTFKYTQPELTIDNFKLRADRIRGYIEDPSIGIDAVEQTLDAAHALSLQCRRDRAVKKLTPEEQRQDAIESIKNDAAAATTDADAIEKVPIAPEADLLLFIRDYNPYLSEWQKDILTIVHEQANYFIPQMETKIMNEGWASFWHHKIMNSLDLPEDLHMEFLVHHNQVVRPHPGSINPYYLGFMLWHDIIRRYDEPTDDEIKEYGAPEVTGMGKIFEVRETDRDVSFLRRFLTKDMMHEMDMFQYEKRGQDYVITDVADENGWQKVKDLLIRSTGMGTVPVIEITDADYNKNRILYLQHSHEGRDLDLKYTEHTLGHLYQLWGREVMLETLLRKKKVVYVYNDNGFSQKKA